MLFISNKVKLEPELNFSSRKGSLGEKYDFSQNYLQQFRTLRLTILHGTSVFVAGINHSRVK